MGSQPVLGLAPRRVESWTCCAPEIAGQKRQALKRSSFSCPCPSWPTTRRSTGGTSDASPPWRVWGVRGPEGGLCWGFGVQLVEEEVEVEEKVQQVGPAQRRQEGEASSEAEDAALLRAGKGRAPRKNPARPQDPARLCYQSREADPSSWSERRPARRPATHQQVFRKLYPSPTGSCAKRRCGWMLIYYTVI